MIISRTPYRISFFGGGTDYPDWYINHGGSVLATTIDKYCYISVRYLPPFFDNKYHIVYSKTESCNSLDEIEHPAVREVIRFLKIKNGLEIHHDGDLPARSGIGSSSSFTVGLLNALYSLQGIMPSKKQLAIESIHIEQNILKETVGSQDQALAAHGGFNNITFHTNGELVVRPVTLSTVRIKELQDHLMLFYTGTSRTASEIAKSYVNNIDNQKKQLRIMQYLVDEALSVLNSTQEIKIFGELLHEAWQFKRSMSPLVSNPFIDDLYQKALSVGALGGKLIGAGGGGFLLLFVPPVLQSKVLEKFSNLIYVPFKFETAGSQIIFYDRQEDYSLEVDRQLNNSKLSSKVKSKTLITN